MAVAAAAAVGLGVFEAVCVGFDGFDWCCVSDLCGDYVCDFVVCVVVVVVSVVVMFFCW